MRLVSICGVPAATCVDLPSLLSFSGAFLRRLLVSRISSSPSHSIISSARIRICLYVADHLIQIHVLFVFSRICCLLLRPLSPHLYVTKILFS